ncbi:MAG: type II toxin-antitoxin system RelB/DinJ family antitoxin [Oscillospiraceae bacterium]|jgi:DNA-damage-inducible protein J|nr:type II toxin-antitoxin system RelB/DinJ family antitoxin [Oscillospiraceae bacterium]
MAKTIQVRVEDNLKNSADTLFASLGLDTSTAIRMFLVAAMESGGIPFAVTHRTDRSIPIHEAIAYRKSGGKFISSAESLEGIRVAIGDGAATSD